MIILKISLKSNKCLIFDSELQLTSDEDFKPLF